MYNERSKILEDRAKRKQILMDIMSSEEYKPLKLKEFKVLLALQPEQVDELKEILGELVAEGKIVCTNRGKYMINEDPNYLVGTFIAHQKGFGFVEIEGRDQDIFIPADKTHDAFHGDIVAVTVKVPAKDGKREEGQIIKVIRHGMTTVIGTFQKRPNFGFVQPDNQKINRDIYIPKGKTQGAIDGHKVLVELTSWGDEEKNKNPEGEVVGIIGHINDPETEIKAIILAYGLPVEFPQEVMEEVEKVPEALDDEMIKKEGHREDWRGVQMVTVDGEDAKDLDDAITLRKIKKGYELGVHIADVTHYVKEKSALDKEALKRGTSAYLVDRVIPMLPHRLSNGICSLNQGQDRFALSCIMEVDDQGKVTKHRVVETLINVDRRMSYTQMRKILVDQDLELRQEYQEFLAMFEEMAELQKILQEKRRKRGAIDFDFPEAKFLLDENGRIKEIYPYERNIATKLIEEFMLLANETIAEEFHWQEVPFLYRSHEEPDPERIRTLSEFIRNYGFKLKGKKEETHPKEIQKLLVDIEGSEQETIISRLALRSMKQAKYTATSDGHFGLATKYYTHFTSPIRRYPDLQIHRIIKDVINGRMDDDLYDHYEEIVPTVANNSSRLERRAEEAEREVSKFKKAEYMEDHVGERYDGVISGVTGWGIYVELPNTIEGMIPIASLSDDYYTYDDKHLCLVGERTGRIFKLGEEIPVELVSIDKKMRTIDFKLDYSRLDKGE